MELNFLKAMRGSVVDTDYSTFIEFIKKNAPGNPFAKPRLGGPFTSDLIKSFSAYYPVATREIYMTEPIRMVNQNIELLPPNAQKYFRKFVNQNLAGMPTTLDAWVRDNILSLPGGQQVYAASNWMANRVGKNLIVGNLNTVLQQPSSIAATVTELGGKYTILGHAYYTTPFGYNLAHNACDVLKGRSVVDIPDNLVSAGEKWVAKPLEILDQTMVGGAFLGSLKKNLDAGMEMDAAISKANDVAGRTQARYKNISRAPILRHTILRNTIGMFQTFTMNMFNYVYQDIIKSPQPIKNKMGMALRFLISALVINEVYNRLGLRKPYDTRTFIPFIGTSKFGAPPHIQITKSLFNKVTGGEETKGENLPSDIFHYLLMPFGGGQLKKIESIMKGESRTAPTAKNPKGKRRFVINGLPENLRTLVGGEWQTKAGQDYLKKIGVINDRSAIEQFMWVVTGDKKYKP